MSNVMEAKAQLVDTISDQLKNSVSTIIVDYHGLSVSEMTELRKQFREAGLEFKVYKNTMTRRAAEKADLSEINDYLTGPNAMAFSNEEVIAPAKILYNFAKEHKALEIKAGVLDGQLTSAEDVNAIAALPSRDGLLAMLLSVLQATVRNFAYAVKAVGEERENEEA